MSDTRKKLIELMDKAGDTEGATYLRRNRYIPMLYLRQWLNQYSA